MNRSEFINILNDPELVSENSLSSIKEILDEYPFFQVGRMLLLKNMHKFDHIRYNSELKHSAVYIPDRSKLFFLLNDIGNEKEESVVSVPEEKLVEDVPCLISEDVERAVVVDEESITQPIPDDVKAEIEVTDDYLKASDDFEEKAESVFNFTFSPKKSKAQIQDDELEDIVLPAADLLDYETTTSAGYLLPDIKEGSGVDSDANRSFSDWLHIMRYSKPEPEKGKLQKKKMGMDLIDSFLSAEPKIIPNVAKKQEVVDLSDPEVEEDEEILSETLADIYIKQGHKRKAIAIFEKLHLKYPEKNVYFVRRIRELKEN